MARAKKRGVKPGTKQGSYKRKRKVVAKFIGLDNPMTMKHYAELFAKDNAKVGKTLRIRMPKDFVVSNVTNFPRSNQSLADQLDAAIENLETKMKSTIVRINTILKVLNG